MALVLVKHGMARLLVVAAFQLAHRDIHAVPSHTCYSLSQWEERRVSARSGARFRAAVEQAAVCTEFPVEHLLAGGKASVVLA